MSTGVFVSEAASTSMAVRAWGEASFNCRGLEVSCGHALPIGNQRGRLGEVAAFGLHPAVVERRPRVPHHGTVA